MPDYKYLCPKCEWNEEISKPVSRHREVENCRQCGTPMDRDYMNEGRRVETGHCGDSYHRDIHSDSLAIHPEQAAEHRQLYPDVPLDSACRPVFTNYRQHDAYLKARGLNHTTKQKWY